jgi:hypothetical protein
LYFDGGIQRTKNKEQNINHKININLPNTTGSHDRIILRLGSGGMGEVETNAFFKKSA